jgi:TIR domain
MKVFLSWSGERSKVAAHALRQWLPDVIQAIEPWMSSEDIDAGARWGSEVTNQLAETRCGIICLTKDNQIAPWVLFEAGALSKTIEKTYVIPYLIDLEPSDILPGPLTQFQAKRANKPETLDLVRTLNGALIKEEFDKPLPDEQVNRMFERCWNELETQLKDLPAPASRPEARSEGDKLTEVLEVVRKMARTITDDINPQLSTQARRLELIQRSINPAVEISMPSTIVSVSSDSQGYSGSKKINVRSEIESILRAKGTLTAFDLANAVDKRRAKRVYYEIQEMIDEGILTSSQPFSSGSPIKLKEFRPPDDDESLFDEKGELTT